MAAVAVDQRESKKYVCEDVTTVFTVKNEVLT